MKIEIKNVASVYSGINGECCCGCSGTHTYASQYRELSGKSRGYAVTDDEVNDQTVALIVSRINKLEIDIDDERYVSAVSGNRLYVAYLR